MASSIHTIYRPLARSRRERVPATRSKSGKLSSVSDAEDETTPEEPIVLEEELEDDFEQMTDRFAPGPEQGGQSLRMALSPLPELDSLELTAKSHPSRSGSMATVKLQRRARLAEKLREVFDVPGIQEVVAGQASDVCHDDRADEVQSQRCHVGCLDPSVSFASVIDIWHHTDTLYAVLQGYMYLTDAYLCFFAHMPSREVRDAFSLMATFLIPSPPFRIRF